MTILEHPHDWQRVRGGGLLLIVEEVGNCFKPTAQITEVCRTNDCTADKAEKLCFVKDGPSSMVIDDDRLKPLSSEQCERVSSRTIVGPISSSDKLYQYTGGDAGKS
jgi:hypothetical protein